jgi:D-cysteine desulfhydrase
MANIEQILKQRYGLGFFPTPLHWLERLSREYANYRIFIKRDDNTGLASGGNKTRKLEYLISRALESGCDTVITAGAQQSNHCRQTAAACSVAGLECHLMLGGRKPRKYDGNLLLSSMLGAQIHFTGQNRKGEDIPEHKKELEAKGRKCFVVPYGGSNFTGTLGFVNAASELKKQLQSLNLQIDYIFFASSSGGTQAGLTLGRELFALNCRLFPVNIDKENTAGSSLEENVLKLVNQGTEKFKLGKEFSLEDIYVNHDYEGPGYGNLAEHEARAIKQMAKLEGILLDPVYTGRAFAGMIDQLEQKNLPEGSNVLFWHTGGLPAIFSYASQLK